MNFALIGAAGYIAPRHLKAIKDTGSNLVAAVDPFDSVGILDRYFDDVDYFKEFERFDRHIEKLRRNHSPRAVDYVSICSPNYLHDAHIRFALRVGADAICEKPLVLNPWNADALQELSEETGKKVYTVLQLRLHPVVMDLKKEVENAEKHEKYDIELTYITPRGKWYFYSWKGDISKSGGLATNIGIHFFDMLTWIFGKVQNLEVHLKDPQKTAGYIELEKARVKWYLSVDKNDLNRIFPDVKTSFRSIKINNKELDFSHGFTDLHTRVYEEVLQGRGFTIKDARPSIEIAHRIRETNVKDASTGFLHPLAEKLLPDTVNTNL
ncbi:Gfo/Idh/MocA family oxidoreductase [bacterium]|nr:Gfo/Idh/MocA family oxidoreductase [bacterium]